jgi:hypothetical protein
MQFAKDNKLTLFALAGMIYPTVFSLLMDFEADISDAIGSKIN